MESRAKFLGHPVHPMLVVFPIGLLAGSFAFDLAYAASARPEFATVSFWTLVVGIPAGLAAAAFGIVDFWAIPAGTRARRIGAWHAIGNAIALLAFAQSWVARLAAPDAPPTGAILLSGFGVAVVFFTGWLGGELVDRLGVGVDDGANLDAPSSLRRRRERVELP